MRVFALSEDEACTMFKAYQLLDTVCRRCNLYLNYGQPRPQLPYTDELLYNYSTRITDISIWDDRTWFS